MSLPVLLQGLANGITQKALKLRATHLGPRSTLLSRRSWLTLGSLEVDNQAGRHQ